MRALTAVIIVLLSSCGGSNPSSSKSSTLIFEPLEIPTCQGQAVYTDAYNGCHSPNGGLLHGLLCFSGEQWTCDRMNLFLAFDTLIKDPLHPENTHHGQGSRDELIGHLLYLVRTHDISHANKLIDMIERTGKLCLDATDNRCDMTPAMWGLMRVVWNHIGLTPTFKMFLGNLGDDTALVITAQTAPIGYQLHLTALQLLIRQHTDTFSMECVDALKILKKRFPTLLVRYLNGENVVPELNQAIQQQKNTSPSVFRYWAWQNPHTDIEDNPASYWFLKNLIEGR